MEQMQSLQNVLEEAGVEIDAAVVEKFSLYQELLLEWNQRVNLISRKDEGRIVTRHFLPSAGLLTVVAFQRGSRVMDLGTGAGFPGLPIKLLRPDLEVVFVESKRKKCLFLRRVVERLGLEGVDVVQGRVETMGEEQGSFDYVLSRAVADLKALARWSMNLLVERNGRLVAMKGPHVDEEIRGAESVLGGRAVQIIPYDPFPDALPHKDSVIVIVG